MWCPKRLDIADVVKIRLTEIDSYLRIERQTMSVLLQGRVFSTELGMSQHLNGWKGKQTMHLKTGYVKTKVTAALLLLLSISGCAGLVVSQVSESEKDQTFSYDGTYAGVVKHAGGRQEMGNRWFTKCSAQDFTARVTIKDSVVTWRWGDGVELQGFINAEGRFRIEQELERKTKGRTQIMSDGTVTAVLQGDLGSESMKGRFVYAVAQFNGNGCTYPVSFEPT